MLICYFCISTRYCSLEGSKLVMLKEWCHLVRKVWRYQRGNQNLYIKEEQTTQCPQEKEQKDKQRSTRHTHKTKE